jgi:hypothetical protein
MVTTKACPSTEGERILGLFKAAYPRPLSAEHIYAALAASGLNAEVREADRKRRKPIIAGRILALVKQGKLVRSEFYFNAATGRLVACWAAVRESKNPAAGELPGLLR